MFKVYMFEIPFVCVCIIFFFFGEKSICAD